MHKIWPGRKAHWVKYENINNSDLDGTVHAGELGPVVNSAPDNNWLNKIGFFLLLQ